MLGSMLAKNRFGVCLDSLRSVEGRTYDTIVIDEVEQVLGHFLSDTIGTARSRIFEVFIHLIRNAKHVIVLDADLGWLSFSTMQMIKTLSPNGMINSKEQTAPCPIRIILNDRKDLDREITVYESKKHLIEKVKAAVLMGKRIFVSSNSKSLIDSLASALEILAEKTETEIPFIKITSANSKSNDIQNFIENITKKITDYQVVLSSPSLGTGVDITFANDAQEIDCVFGFYEARITNHFEIDRQLARVRNPKQVDVWVSPQKFNFESKFDVVVDDLLRGDLIGAIRYGLMWQDRAAIADQDPFLTMVALTTIEIYESGEFLLDVEYSSEDLELFAKKSLILKRFVEGQFKIATWIRTPLTRSPCLAHSKPTLKKRTYSLSVNVALGLLTALIFGIGGRVRIRPSSIAMVRTFRIATICLDLVDAAKGIDLF